ncbi:PIR protein [Plasmodium yoelii]|uniref:PIR protein n=2 Tax=Plasmodium yoelii TaxID=5861 RepID=A0AAE9X4D3_PLAYO|nr:PIR protein [Plasmodium yoelii]WBY61352.1 PIR protein [Plasmodium yoelii yoelii]VTZ82006.1 PIR protein [Plasmodium yoelii]|eukprot:XP_022810919.1 PIR protein [Plasmodium yoelii]
MDKRVCEKFQEVRNSLSDELSSGSYKFNDVEFLNKYCDSNTCQSDLDKISAGCLYLLDQFYKNGGILPPPAKNNINIVDYILIWLNYMLNLGKSKEKDNIQDFYRDYIYNYDKYKMEINELSDYDNYKKLLDKKNDVLNMDSKIVPKLYKAFKSLCEMYTEFDENKEDCTNYSEKAKEFVKQYEKLYEDYNKTKDSSYKKVLCTLSADYDNLIKKCNDTQCCKTSPLPTIETEKIPENCSEQTSEKTYGTGYDELSGEISEVTLSESSLVSKLFIVLSIFGAIAIFLGISYKYSLFGFRKRFQKQKLREKLKNVKKRMIH